MSSGFSSIVLRLLCLSAAFYLAEQQLPGAAAAGDLRVDLKNLRESQSWDRAVERKLD